ncbi:hypothetical protein GCM10010394_46650 [Streptomyces crystallinus]|uniref:Uncharacterized protein n=1 Tax=Streptomyces crystallinus TaxID=68191 RepID=A0ABN1GHA4_9ACTN
MPEHHRVADLEDIQEDGDVYDIARAGEIHSAARIAVAPLVGRDDPSAPAQFPRQTYESSPFRDVTAQGKQGQAQEAVLFCRTFAAWPSKRVMLPDVAGFAQVTRAATRVSKV